MPPKTQGKLSVEAQAEVGALRECIGCGEFKTVSHSHFNLSSKGLRGWAKLCRACMNLARSEDIMSMSIKERKDVNEERTTDIEEMYALHASNRKPGRVDDIAEQLASSVRRLVDSGHRDQAFELFIEIVKPLIAGWMEPGEIHKDIKEGLLSDHRRCLIIATRYSAKSTLTAIYVAFEIFNDPLIKIMVISRGSKLAARMLRTVRRVLIANCPMLRHLEPTDDCLDNAEQFQTPQTLRVVTGGASLTSLGMGSNLPGFRSDLTIGDDVEGPQDDTPEKVQQLEEDLNELHMINPRGRKIMLGTYQSEFSVYAKLADLVDTEGEAVWELHRACMFEEDRIDGKEVIHSRWTDMFSDTDALDWRRSVTTRAWKLHAMLIADPSILHERPLKISDLPVLRDYNPKGSVFPLLLERTRETIDGLTTWSAPKGDVWFEGRSQGTDAPLSTIIMAVDPASGLAGRDAIGVAVLGVTQGGMGIILHLEGVRSADKTTARKRVAEIGANYKASVCVVEELADGLFGETLEGEFVLVDYPMTVEKVTTGGQQKGRRIIENLAPPMGAGRLGILEQVARSDHGGEFVNQLVRISYDGRTGKAKDHDDIVDALAHAVARVKYALVSDIAQNFSDHSAAKLDRWARVPMRDGGLGGFTKDEYPNSRSIELQGDNLSLADALMQEDEVLIALSERRDRFQETVSEDIRFGRKPEQRTIDKVKQLTRQIKELQELNVL